MPLFYAKLVFFSVAIAVAVALGGLVPLCLSFSRKHMPALLSFAAGVMLGAATVHLLPESFEARPENAGLWILCGFLFLYLFEKFVMVHICEAINCEVHQIGLMAFVGLALHALTEGVALGTGMLTAGIGGIVFISILLHKLPAALALTSVLLHEHYRKRSIVILQGFFFLMLPLGAIILNTVSHEFGGEFLGAALGFSTGTFFHISLSDLLPEVHRSGYGKTPALITFLIGLVIMVFVKYGVPLGH